MNKPDCKCNENSPFLIAQKLIQGKWAMVIIYYLKDGPVRFNELQRMLPKMTHATLSKQLKQLVKDGLIIRKEYAQIPPKVEYELSDIGREFQPVILSLYEWGKKYMDYQENIRND